MSYSPTKYGNVDLALKEVRQPGAKKDPVVAYFQKAYLDLGGPPVKTSSGKVQPMIVDGDFGTQTKNGLLAFQKASGVPTTGILDDLTYFQLDWRVYAGWTPCSLSLTSTGQGGPAIVKGFNEIVVPKVRVNAQGMSRTAMRIADVRKAFVKRDLGTPRAVKRAARGASSDLDGASDHWCSIADDETGDQNKDRAIDFDEIELQLSLFNYMLIRAQRGPAYKYQKLVLQYQGDTSTRDRSARGMDMSAVMVIGNLKRGNGQYMFPTKLPKKDVSWSAGRNTVKQLTGTVHTAPFHLHHSVNPYGAPEGSPFS